MPPCDDTFSLEEVYAEGIDIPARPYAGQEKDSSDIEFEDPDVSDEIRDALAALSAQFHYTALAQLTLLGSIIAEDSHVRAKRLAALLIPSRIRAVDFWGRYLHVLGTGGNIRPELRNYFQQLYEDGPTVSTLIGIVFLDALIWAISDNLDSHDVTFEHLLQKNIAEAKNNRELAESSVTHWDDWLPEDEKHTFAGTIQYHTTLLKECITACNDDLETVNVDTTAALHAFEDRVTAFYRNLRLSN